MYIYMCRCVVAVLVYITQLCKCTCCTCRMCQQACGVQNRSRWQSSKCHPERVAVPGPTTDSTLLSASSMASSLSGVRLVHHTVCVLSTLEVYTCIYTCTLNVFSFL